MRNFSLRIKIGMRFELYKAKFEVAFVDDGVVRYAANAGGRQYQVSLEKFKELVDLNKIKIEETKELSVKKVMIAIRKKHYVDEVVKLNQRSISDIFARDLIDKISIKIADNNPPKLRTLRKWVSEYRRIGESSIPSKDRYGNTMFRFSIEIEGIIKEAISMWYLKRESFSAVYIHSYIVGVILENPSWSTLKLPSLRTIQRRLKNIDPYRVLIAQKGSVEADKKARAAGRKRFVNSVVKIVQFDTHKLDVLIVDEETNEVIGRPFLSCAIDVNSKCVVGKLISLIPPSATSSLLLIKNMIERENGDIPGGLPSVIIPDNGVEFANTAFQRVCESLKITISPAQVRDPNGKSEIERFFRTLTDAAIQVLSGTTFSNTTVRGDYQSEKKAIFTLSQLDKIVSNWIESIYHKTPQGYLKRAPISIWNECKNKAATFKTTQSEIDSLARIPYVRKINQGRVQVDHLTYFSHALKTLELLNKFNVVVLVNEMDLSFVYVEDPDNKNNLIKADSIDPEYTKGLNAAEHAEVLKIRKKMTDFDLKKYGDNSFQIARYEFMKMIHQESKHAKSRINRLKRKLNKKSDDNDVDLALKKLKQGEIVVLSNGQPYADDYADSIQPNDGIFELDWS